MYDPPDQGLWTRVVPVWTCRASFSWFPWRRRNPSSTEAWAVALAPWWARSWSTGVDLCTSSQLSSWFPGMKSMQHTQNLFYPSNMKNHPCTYQFPLTCVKSCMGTNFAGLMLVPCTFAVSTKSYSPCIHLTPGWTKTWIVWRTLSVHCIKQTSIAASVHSQWCGITTFGLA